MHPLLERQIKKLNLNKGDKKLKVFLDCIDDAYHDFQDEKDLAERSLDISSRELTELNARLRSESQKHNIVINSLKQAITELKSIDNNFQIDIDDQDDTLYLTNALVKMIQSFKKFQRDLQKSEQELKNQKEFLETIIDTLPVGVFLTDTEGVPQLVNKVGIDILGKGIDPRCDKEGYAEIYSIVKQDRSPYPNKDLPLTEVLRSHQATTKDDVCVDRGKDEPLVELSATSVPIMNSQQKMIAAVVVFQDITEQRQIDRAKSEFVSLASHQLRTPLSAINWYTELLLNGEQGDMNISQKEFLQEIYESSKRMTRLVSGLLNVSRIELGTFAINPQLLDIREICQSVLKELQMTINEKNMHVRTDFATNIPVIPLDPDLTRIIFQNFLTNSMKYSPSDSYIDIAISCNNQSLMLSVKDYGYGIPAKQQNRIFSKMFRAENILHNSTEGTGLGLYIVKSIVDEIDGDISFESKENEGTTFYVNIPITGMKMKSGNKGLSIEC